jgi:ubiquinone/menaquinone biosynthesis C-methylase UbiE
VSGGAILERAAPFLRLPGSPDRPPEVLAGGEGLREPGTGRVFPYRDGILDLLGEGRRRTLSQLSLDTAVTAWLYDRMRDSLLRLAGMPDFATEVATIQSRLQLAPGDVVLDLACGHGNFTAAWARHVGPTGLVIGLDLSRSMLARATERLRGTGVLLVRGDALSLPVADAAVRKVNCSGGFHAFPDLPRALAEIARVSAPGAVLTASMFAAADDDERPRLRDWLRRAAGLHFVSLPWLGRELQAVGYVDYRSTAPRAGFGYASARKPGD